MARSTGNPAKSIVLFSDGTGNSSAKLFKTNVWRMYEAVDLGPSPTGERDQISFYDDGVGTSNFKFLAAIGGAFGWGLKRNVLDLYRYACRNYRKGDRIYAFGFSRGAFTIRLVTALIASQGLVQSKDESELNRKSNEAYRAFRSTFQRRKFKKFTQSAKLIREKAGGTTKAEDSSEKNLPATIRFVGVWDTVAAYGGPIAEITRAIDNWIYPLSMPDYELHESVQCARHALAIDDERDAFQPLLWDELAEERRANEAVKARQVAMDKSRKTRSKEQRKRHLRKAERCATLEQHFRTRMQQVWFTGMHADVGGGYPDESLSYVSLLWMMEEAEKAGLRTLPAIKDRFFALANSYGPMHDSRSGIGSYYRYQPRKIAAWVDSSNAQDRSRYLMLRDPDVRDADGVPRGLLRCVCVHESVIARINSGTVRYAPIALPRSFQVVPPQREGETVEQTGDSARTKCRYDRPPSEPLITPKIRGRVEVEDPNRFARQENLWDLVWWRRMAYFATVIVTLQLAALPFLNLLPSFVDQLCSDSRCWLPSLIRPAKALVPGIADPWIAAIARYPFTPFILGGLIYWLMRRSNAIEGRLRDECYRLWRDFLDDRPIGETEESGLRKFREGPAYQKTFQAVKWSILPALFGILMVLGLLYIPTVGITQLAIQIDEADHYFCPIDDPKSLKPVAGQPVSVAFNTRQTCTTPGLLIKTNQPYDLVFQMPVSPQGEPVPWWDEHAYSKPGSLTRVRASGFFQVIGVPTRRVIEASYLQPMAHVSKMPEEEKPHWWQPEFIRKWRSKFDRVHVTKLNLVPDEEWPELYRVRFVARSERNEDRILHFFPNEAHLPFTGRRFYDNNCGYAMITVIKVVPRRPGTPKPYKMEEPGSRVPPPPCSNDPDRLRILQKAGAATF
ncbi:MAG TPA: DUF2235 domain-containing protein [Sphingomicrobium sp.]|nr:DUF2235 domain-containing protein [Sphingomicrobium sp.]